MEGITVLGLRGYLCFGRTGIVLATVFRLARFVGGLVIGRFGVVISSESGGAGLVFGRVVRGGAGVGFVVIRFRRARVLVSGVSTGIRRGSFGVGGVFVFVVVRVFYFGLRRSYLVIVFWM